MNLKQAEESARKSARVLWFKLSELSTQAETLVNDLEAERDHAAREHDGGIADLDAQAKRAGRTGRHSQHKAHRRVLRKQKQRRDRYHHHSELIGSITAGMDV